MRSHKFGLPSFPGELHFGRGWPCLSCVAAAEQPCVCPGSYPLNPDTTWSHTCGLPTWPWTYLATVYSPGCHCTKNVPSLHLWAWSLSWFAASVLWLFVRWGHHPACLAFTLSSRLCSHRVQPDFDPNSRLREENQHCNAEQPSILSLMAIKKQILNKKS